MTKYSGMCLAHIPYENRSVSLRKASQYGWFPSPTSITPTYKGHRVPALNDETPKRRESGGLSRLERLPSTY